MSLAKRLGRSPAVRAVACWLIARYIRLVELTSRWVVHDVEALARMAAEGTPFVAAFWHGRMVMMPGVWRRYGARRPFHMLISQHRDGRMISAVIAHLGIETIVGSTSRGAAAALRGLLKTVAGGGFVGVTPDGPRGPRMRASPGLVMAASRTGAPVFALSYSATRRRLFGSWDRFLLPLPFARVVIVVKGPFEIPRDLSAEGLEAARRMVEDALNDATREADEACGLAPVEPAAEPAGKAPRLAGSRT
jgi:lysophospholipid acyltransferase (LPLAT)-like uncharacterized protein